MALLRVALGPQGAVATQRVHATWTRWFSKSGRADAQGVTPESINSYLRTNWAAAAGEPGAAADTAHSLTGCQCHEVSDRHVIVSRMPSAADIRPGGFVCGPFQFALADVGMWFACFGAYGRIEPMALTTELSIRYLRPAVMPSAGPLAPLWARVDVNSAGSRTMVSTATVWVDDPCRPTAIAQGTYAMPR